MGIPQKAGSNRRSPPTQINVKKVNNGTACYPRNKDERIFFAQLAAAAGRHQDVIYYLNPLLPYSLIPPRNPHIIKSQNGATAAASEIRSLLSVAYKNLTNNLRTSWKTIHGIEVATVPRRRGVTPHKIAHRVNVELTGEARKKVEKELKIMCEKILKLVAHMLELLHARGRENVEEKVFWLKMKGDYLRYLIEISQASNSPFAIRNIEGFEKEAFNAYSISFQLSHDDAVLEPTHPTRLGIGLNFAVFYHDIKHSPIRAIHVAKFVFDVALEGILENSEIVAKSYARKEGGAEREKRVAKIVEALLILQILKDDIMVWSTEIV